MTIYLFKLMKIVENKCYLSEHSIQKHEFPSYIPIFKRET